MMQMIADLKKKIYAAQVVNGGRQPELDLAKTVDIVCMGFVHCVIECTPESSLARGVPYVFDTILGGPLGAPVYMFAMGAGMSYTAKHTPSDYVRRGIRIGLIGYLLNVCRFLIPFLTGFWLTGDHGKYIAPLPYRFFGNDILQFASLAMLLMALLVRLRIPDMGMLAFCLFLSILGTGLNGIDTGSPFCNTLLGYVIGTEDAAGMVISDFPLLNWMIVPVSGYVFARRLLHVKEKKLFYGILSGICLPAAVIYFAAGIRGHFGMFGEGQNCYYHLSFCDAAASLAMVCGMLGLYAAVVPHLPDRTMRMIREISSNINAIYCIHWVLITVSIDVIIYTLYGTQELPLPLTMLLGAAVTVTAIAVAHVWNGRKRRIRGGPDAAAVRRSM